jgi:hypothetical protein
MINARSETLTEKPSFKQLLGTHRCLIPADGFYEWRRDGKGKVPMRIVMKDRQLFTFAGLWDVWRGDLEAGELNEGGGRTWMVEIDRQERLRAMAFRSGSFLFFTTLSFSANAVRMFTGSDSRVCTLAGCPSGLNGRLT